MSPSWRALDIPAVAGVKPRALEIANGAPVGSGRPAHNRSPTVTRSGHRVYRPCMTLVAGVDLATQSTKVVVCDADSGDSW